MVAAALLTSNSQQWETPKAFFDRLNSAYRFTLDACATQENAKCENFFSPEQDGLKQSWSGHSVWINPPYQPARKACKFGCKKATCVERGHLTYDVAGQYDWVKKAHDEVRENNCRVAVCLLPARTDTKLFHDYVMRASMVWFVRGRLTFVGAPASAVFPSMIVTFESWQKHTVQPQPRFASMTAR